MVCAFSIYLRNNIQQVYLYVCVCVQIASKGMVRIVVYKPT